MDITAAGKAALEAARKILKALADPVQALKITDLQRLEAAHTLITVGDLPTFVPLLSLCFNLNGEPYNLDDHFPLEPVFNRLIPDVLVNKGGRQYGKCRRVSAQETVLASDGRPLKPYEIVIGTELLALDDRYRWTVCKVTGVHHSPIEPVFLVKTRMGSAVTLTASHPLRVLNGYRSVAELAVGDRVAALTRGGIFVGEPASRSKIITTAYLIGDGCCGTSNFVSLTSASEQVLQEYVTAVGEINGREPEIDRNRPGLASQIRTYLTDPLARQLAGDGLLGKYAWEKHVPAWVFRLSEEDTRLFVSRLWATDGGVKRHPRSWTTTDGTKRRGKIVDIDYCTTSFQLSRDVRALMTKLGICVSIRQRKTGYRKDGIYKQCRDAYIVRVETREGLARFQALLAVPGKPAVKLPTSRSNNNRHTIPFEVSNWLAELAAATKYKHSDSLKASGLRPRPKYPLSRSKLQEYIDYFDRVNPSHHRLIGLQDLRDGDVAWDEILSISQVDEAPVYDIETDGGHNYILDGLVSHNSTFQAARSLAITTSLPYFSTLFVFPLYEQVSRFSTQYVSKFIEESPIRAAWMGQGSNNSVLTKTFRNRSKMTFSFSGLSAERIRGVAANNIIYDECQNIDRRHVSVINEALSHSKILDKATGKKRVARPVVYTGTPKTMENLLEHVWQESSMAEWVIPCRRCKKWNYPTLGLDIDRMIGPLHKDIGEEHEGKKPGTICASPKCGLPVNPRNGFWHHRYPDRAILRPGYHIPQIIIPVHYADYKGWAALLGKRAGAGNFTAAKFYNEVLGESWDSGAKIITETDLKRAAVLPWRNDPHNFRDVVNRTRSRYVCKFLGADWGGGGEDETSFTACAVVGLLPDGKLDIIYGRRLLLTHDPIAEAEELLRIFTAFECSFFCHDYNGSGNLHETYMIQAGLSIDKIAPFVYYRSGAKNIVVPHKGQHEHSRSYYLLDKARSLQLTCEMIKLQRLRSFQFDFVNADDRGLLMDFTSLVAARIETARAGDVYSIHRNPAFPCDFADAVNFACCGIWHSQENWPNLPDIARLRLSPEQHEVLNPTRPWQDYEVSDEY